MRDPIMPPGRMMPSERDQSWTNPRRRRGKAQLVQAIEEALRDPEPTETIEQFAKYHHDDIAALSLDEIDDERWRLRTAKAFYLITEWGLERLTVLDRESDRRRQVRR